MNLTSDLVFTLSYRSAFADFLKYVIRFSYKQIFNVVTAFGRKKNGAQKIKYKKLFGINPLHLPNLQKS